MFGPWPTGGMRRARRMCLPGRTTDDPRTMEFAQIGGRPNGRLTVIDRSEQDVIGAAQPLVLRLQRCGSGMLLTGRRRLLGGRLRRYAAGPTVEAYICRRRIVDDRLVVRFGPAVPDTGSSRDGSSHVLGPSESLELLL